MLLDLVELDDTDELSSSLWLYIEMIECVFLFWLDLNELDDTDELSSSLWLCIEMLNKCNLTWTSWTTLTSCPLACDCLKICMLYFTWLGQVGRHGRVVFKPLIVYGNVWMYISLLIDLDELDDTDKLSSSLWLCIEMLNKCNLTWTSWTTRRSCPLACDCVKICMLYVTWLGRVGWHGRVVL